jgi:serine/threonine protein kinase/tetratricopeptide (TPR) repeat protein
MGLVFSAWDTRLQREVAIKLLREEYATPGMRQRFLQEARAASRLNHPNICTIFDMGEQEGDPYLVMELLKGETVRGKIARGPASTSDIICVATEVADALTVAHGRGIIHRDIKPANIILVDKDHGRFQAKVLDFGLAKVERDGAESRMDLTSAGTTVGTVAYMSPEQARGEALDARSDLFSLGTVLYEMATGELPFQGATSALVFVQLLSQSPEPVRDFNPDIPKDLEKLILTLLEKNRGDRIQSAAGVVEALARINPKKASKGFWSSNKPAKSWGPGENNRPEKRNQPATLPARPATRESILESIHESRLHASSAPAPEPPPAANPPSHSSETFLRPVKRIVAGDSSRPVSNSELRSAAAEPKAERTETKPERPEVQPSAFALFQAASTASRGASSSSDRIAAAPILPARVTPPAERPVAWSSSGVMPRFSEADATAASEAAARQAASMVAPAADLPTPLAYAAPAEAVAAPKSSPSRMVSTRPLEKKFNASEMRQVADDPVPAERVGSRIWVSLVLLLLVALAGVGVWYKLQHKGLSSASTSSLLLASLENRTGDSTLGGVFNAGLLLDLRQSPHLSLRWSQDLQSGAKAAGVSLDGDTMSLDDARKIANAAGDSLVGFGSIAQDGGAYTLTMRVYDAGSGSKVTEATATATSREQVGDAIDRLTSDVRLGLGETGDSISNANTPLSREASSNPDALQAFANAYGMEAAGKTFEAMTVYESAVKFDPRFTQAYLALAQIYRQQHAEVEAASAATHAQDSAANASQRTQALAQASYALNRLGNPAQAAQILTQLCTQYPADIEALLSLATAQRAARNDDAALATAQSVLQISPLQRDARAEAELALIGLERVDEASDMEQQAQEGNQGHAAIAILLGFLNQPVPSAIPAEADNEQLAVKMERADVLDGEGQFAAGLALWRDAINRAKPVSTIASTVSFALARSALNRALSGDCVTSEALLRESITMPSGPQASLDAGVAHAVCGNQAGAKESVAALTAPEMQDAAAKTLYAPVVSAAIQWKAGDGEGAANLLQGKTDQLWLAAYLSGLIHIGSNAAPAALTDLQPLTVHHGSVAEEQPEVVALGEFQAARVFDSRNGPIHYKNFTNLWSNADPGNALLTQAQTQTR